MQSGAEATSSRNADDRQCVRAIAARRTSGVARHRHRAVDVRCGAGRTRRRRHPHRAAGDRRRPAPSRAVRGRRVVDMGSGRALVAQRDLRSRPSRRQSTRAAPAIRLHNCRRSARARATRRARPLPRHAARSARGRSLQRARLCGPRGRRRGTRTRGPRDQRSSVAHRSTSPAPGPVRGATGRTARRCVGRDRRTGGAARYNSGRGERGRSSSTSPRTRRRCD